MKTYREYCPIAKGAEVIGDRWNLLILRELISGPKHFNEVQRFLPGISRSVLAQRLEQLQHAGVVERNAGESGRTVEYRFTEAGEELRDVVLAVGNWAARWAFPAKPAESEMDPLLVMVWLSRHLQTDQLPRRRVVIGFTLKGLRPGRFWLVLEPEEPSLCHPGFEEDIEVTVETGTLYQIYFGRLSMTDAIARGLMRVDGLPRDTRAFPSWFGPSGFAPYVRKAG